MRTTLIDVISSLLCLKIIPFPYLTDTFIDVSLNYRSFWSLTLLEVPVKSSSQKHPNCEKSAYLPDIKWKRIEHVIKMWV